MSFMSAKSAADTGHLQYYRAQGIAPVHYEMRTLTDHFERRDSLYRTLGLPPVAFRGCRVLEVAAGTGQNSLYVAACQPASLDLVEPNPKGVEEIEALYREHEGRLIKPRLHTVEFEKFEPSQTYDVVLCENWLGSLPRELALVRKLGDLVAPGGALVLTIVPYSGFFPNVLRRLLALRILDARSSFAEQTAMMIEAFGPHLATIASMTRSHQHWVQDCVLNPHYLNVALSLDTVLHEVGGGMEALGSSPRFATEWRWFKGLAGADREFNDSFYRAYVANLHNFIDYRRLFPAHTAEENFAIEDGSRALHQAAVVWERQAVQGNAPAPQSDDDIAMAVRALSAELRRIEPAWSQALDEVEAMWLRPTITARDIAAMTAFAPLFGRETVYVSFTKPAW